MTKKAIAVGDPVTLDSDGMVVGVDPANGNQCVIGVVQAFNAEPNRNGDVYQMKGFDTKEFVSGRKKGEFQFVTTEVVGRGYGNFDGLRGLFLDVDPPGFPATPFDNLIRHRPFSMGRFEHLFQDWSYR